ncbi:hypothetical protein [Streptomyces lunaelactis]|uniref:hypothetical protein n=1 Tax=Streptomyces lunaelactis TaxID=1535768 RepID=UPI001584BC77|nr:hypothetical protein [Streptomyces lunaelactis]NUK01777.1 hypothetical protein [Streptomyces lunaelactis]NUK14987.1 hypothetical protein [Streptomyces lunaelactis]
MNTTAAAERRTRATVDAVIMQARARVKAGGLTDKDKVAIKAMISAAQDQLLALQHELTGDGCDG